MLRLLTEIRVMVVVVVVGLALWPGAVLAQNSGFGWTGTMQFQPGRVITAKGGTLGALMSEMFGPTAMGGSVALSGEIRYTIAPHPQVANTVAAGYQNAITSASVTLGSATLVLDAPLVAANAASSKVGMGVTPGGAFCGDAEHCAAVGMSMMPMGNMIGLLNDTPHFLIDEAGTSTQIGDALVFMMGRTVAVGEFTPALQTQGFGVVAVDGVVVGMMSTPGGHLLSGLHLPAMAQFLGTPHIGRTEIWVTLEGAQLLQPVKIEGAITQFALFP